MTARLIHEKDQARRARRTGQNVPARQGQITAGYGGRGRPAACRDDHCVRRFVQHIRRLGIAVLADLDPEPFHFGDQPIGHAPDLPPDAPLAGQQKLTTQTVCGVHQDHVMAAQGRHARGLQPAGTTANDHHLATRVRGRDHMGHHRLAPRCGVVAADGRLALVHAIHTGAKAHAGANALFLAAHQFRDQMGIGDMGAGHADEVHVTLAQRVARGGQIGDPARVDHGQPRRLTDAARNGQMRRRWHAHGRNPPGQTQIVVRCACKDVEEIHLPRLGQHPRDSHAVIGGQPRAFQFIAGHADAEDHLGPHGSAHCRQNLQRQAQAVFKRPAIVVLPVIDEG